MLAHRELKDSMFDDSDLSSDEDLAKAIDGAFMFNHPTIEAMTQSLCGQCGCPYCDVEETSEVGESEKAVAHDSPPVPDVAPFTQFVGSIASKPNAALYEAVGPRFRRSTDGMECAYIEESKAWIGSPTLAVMGVRPLANEMPCHEVRLNAFLMDIEPVSVGAYA